MLHLNCYSCTVALQLQILTIRGLYFLFVVAEERLLFETVNTTDGIINRLDLFCGVRVDVAYSQWPCGCRLQAHVCTAMHSGVTRACRRACIMTGVCVCVWLCVCGRCIECMRTGFHGLRVIFRSSVTLHGYDLLASPYFVSVAS